MLSRRIPWDKADQRPAALDRTSQYAKGLLYAAKVNERYPLDVVTGARCTWNNTMVPTTTPMGKGIASDGNYSWLIDTHPSPPTASNLLDMAAFALVHQRAATVGMARYISTMRISAGNYVSSVGFNASGQFTYGIVGADSIERTITGTTVATAGNTYVVYGRRVKGVAMELYVNGVLEATGPDYTTPNGGTWNAVYSSQGLGSPYPAETCVLHTYAHWVGVVHTPFQIAELAANPSVIFAP